MGYRQSDARVAGRHLPKPARVSGPRRQLEESNDAPTVAKQWSMAFLIVPIAARGWNEALSHRTVSLKKTNPDEHETRSGSTLHGETALDRFSEFLGQQECPLRRCFLRKRIATFGETHEEFRRIRLSC